MSMAQSVWHNYILGNAVEDTANWLFAPKNNASVDAVIAHETDMKLQAKKISAFWLVGSGIVATAASPGMPIVAASLAPIALIPFVRPFFKNSVGYLKGCSRRLSNCQKVKGVVSFIFCAGVQEGTQYTIESMVKNKSYNAALGIGLTNMTILGTVYFTYRMLGSSDQRGSNSSPNSESRLVTYHPPTRRPSISDTVQTTIQQLEEDIKELEKKIARVDTFICINPQLKKLAAEAFEKDKDNFAIPEKVKFNLDEPNSINRMTAMRKQKLVLEHLLKERELFFERNPELKESFDKHIAEYRNSPVNPFERQLPPSSVTIEEVDE